MKDYYTNGSILLEHSLQSFFFDELTHLNKKQSSPIPNELIYYSSLVLDTYGDANQYFEQDEDGRTKEKLLGMKLMEANQYSRGQQEKLLKEVGDTALLLCGFFSASLGKKLTDESYYCSVGRTAYKRLNSLVPNVLEIPDFYGQVAYTFHSLTNLMSVISEKFFNEDCNDAVFILSADKKSV